MIIREVAFGNSKEAFIEKRFSSSVNIIYSNDNNKGKTLLIQGLLYSMGNNPIFPTGFIFHDYYFYSKVEINQIIYEFIRKKNIVIVKNDKNFQIFDSIVELKYYINKHIFKLPIINKNTTESLVGLGLFYQIFFIGQDKRNTSNIQNPGQYNKKDFMSMLNSMNGARQSLSNDFDIEETKKKIKQKQVEIKAINKKMTIVNDNPQLASLTLKDADQEEFTKCNKSIKDIYGNISKYKRQRNNESNRRIKLENLLSELRSLNYQIEIGKVKCLKCGSDKIVYSSGDMSFELSNKNVRDNILNSIKTKINMMSEKINEITESINIEQDRLNLFLKEIPINIEDILFFKEDILNSDQYSSELIQLKADIEELKEDISQDEAIDKKIKDKNKSMLESILVKMNDLYRIVDPSGILDFKNLFTKSDENYSGSEEQEFYFCKILAIYNYFKHSFPIIIDSFRSGELSTGKEYIMIKQYIELKNQVILTSTLKTEEHEALKYDKIEHVNAIDYSSYQNSQILQSSYVDDFKKILIKFDLEIEN